MYLKIKKDNLIYPFMQVNNKKKFYIVFVSRINYFNYYNFNYVTNCRTKYLLLILKFIFENKYHNLIIKINFNIIIIILFSYKNITQQIN